MGTRNLVAVMSGGKYVVAQYGQWDGYPSGQGVTVLDFCRKHLRKPTDRARFVAKLTMCRFVDDAESRRMWDDVGASGEWVTMAQAAAHTAKHPSMSRDTGGDILDIIRRAEREVPLRDSIDFAGDSLMCEWAYVIDLDRGALEVFKGFNTRPIGRRQRFANAPHKYTPSGKTYYPVRQVGAWPLGKLPTKRAFLRELGGES